VLTNPNVAWATIPQSQWISSQADSSQTTDGDYFYRTCFCLRDGFSKPSLQLSLRADDQADVFLNNTLAQIKSSNPPAPILQGTASSFSPFRSPDQLNPPFTGPFQIGENCLIVRVKNSGGVATGLNLVGSITASGPNGSGGGLLTPECCHRTGSICGMKWNDLNHDGVHQSTEPGLQGWTIQLSNGQTAVTDQFGNYCFSDLAPSVYTVQENLQAGWVQKHPSRLYSVTVVAATATGGIDFGNCKGPDCGSDSSDDGDPHLTTVDGIHYNFQSAGEFVSLSDGNSLQIQTRQTPGATTFNPGPDPYDGLATCVSINTAVAARVGTHRVTLQPNLSGVPDPSGLQLRVDGVLTKLGANGLDLGSGGRVMASAGGAVRIDFPDGTVLLVTPGWWVSQRKWYLNVSVFHTTALEGTMGTSAPGSWLPALPNGTSLGSMPASLHQRYVDLNQTFADAWRVTPQTSLFDYAPGTSTATFTLSGWPKENPPCVIPGQPPVKPLDPQAAQRACRLILDKNRNADCVFDVRVTGETGFAKTYLLTQQIQAGSTTTTMNDDKDPTPVGEPVTFTATVARTAAGGSGVPTGTVQFVLDGSKVGAPIKLDSSSRATWTTSSLKAGNHQVAAGYIPARNSVFLASSSLNEPHTVTGPNGSDCAKTVVVSGIHFPNKTCAQSSAEFQAGLLTSFFFTSKCPQDAPLRSVFDISCQNAPIPGFATGSVYQGTACCGKAAPPVTISNLPMQGGDEKTPCPALGVIFKRSDAASVPYLGILLPNLDQQCGAKGPELLVATVKFLKCAPDPRGKGFGPNASADITCAK
jgi:hypothetical protein